MLLRRATLLARAGWRGGAPRRRASGQAAASYSKLTDADLAFFRSVLAENDVITDASALEQYNVDWMKKYEGKSKLALRPRSTQQVSQILKHCNERRLPVVPQGGNTGLVGGSVAVDDEVVLSLSGMDKILAFDEYSGTVTCQAGAVLQAVQEKAEANGYAFPLDLGAKGSCQIGGNVATNAGGLRYLRYGSLHGTVLGIEAVLADGTIVDNLNTLKKDNTGYDVKQLFIGSEGTLGVVTGVAIALPKLPNSVQLAYLAVDSYESVLKVFREAKGHLAEILSAVEFLDDQALDLTLRHLHGARNPLEARAPFYMLIEVRAACTFARGRAERRGEGVAHRAPRGRGRARGAARRGGRFPWPSLAALVARRAPHFPRPLGSCLWRLQPHAPTAPPLPLPWSPGERLQRGARLGQARRLPGARDGGGHGLGWHARSRHGADGRCAPRAAREGHPGWVGG